jgi:cytochrome c
MKKSMSIVLSIIMIACFATLAVAITKADKDEIVAVVDKTVAMLEKEGKAGLDKIPTIRFGENNYVYVGDMTCTIIAHGWQPHLVGKSIMGIKDDTGFKFMAKLMEGVNNSTATKNGKTYCNGATWVTYRWPAPDDKTKFKNKVVYAKGCLMGDENVFVSAGMYE